MEEDVSNDEVESNMDGAIEFEDKETMGQPSIESDEEEELESL